MQTTNSEKTHEQQIAVIGCGNLGGTLVRGLATKFSRSPMDIIACDSTAEKVRILAQELGVRTTTELERAADDADIVIIAVKPSGVSDVLHRVRKIFEGASTTTPLIISVAAGITIDTIQGSLGNKEYRIVRVMPNLPCLVGVGMSVFYTKSDDDAAITQAIFQTMGRTLRVDNEQDLHAVTALSAGGPAFLFTVIEALADGGVKVGLSREKALLLAAQTMQGAGAMVLETGKHPEELKDMVASPGGTTIEGLHVLEAAGIRGAFISAVEASARKSKYLGKV